MEQNIIELKQHINHSVKNQRQKEFIFKWVNNSIMPYLNQLTPKIKILVFLLVKLQKDLAVPQDESSVGKKVKTWNELVKKLKNATDDVKEIWKYSEWSMIAPEYNNYETFCSEFFPEPNATKSTNFAGGATKICEKSCDDKCGRNCAFNVLDNIDLSKSTALKNIEEYRLKIDQQLTEIKKMDENRKQQEDKIRLQIEKKKAKGFSSTNISEIHETENQRFENDKLQNLFSGNKDAEPKNDQKTVKIVTKSNGVRYKGDYVDGKKEGKGIYYYDNGSYDGQFKNDKRHGKGVYTWSDGDKYEGDWYNGNCHGKGVKYFTNGNKYDGEWKNHKMTGKGVFTWKCGDKYEGDYVDGKKEGKGIFYYDNGSYDGQWKNDKKHGKGVYTWLDVDKYDGEWKNGYRHGHGVMFYQDGSKFDGEWKDDKKHGKGISIKNQYSVQEIPSFKSIHGSK